MATATRADSNISSRPISGNRSRIDLENPAILLVTAPSKDDSLPIPSKLRLITPKVSPNAWANAGPNNSDSPPPSSIKPSAAFIIADIVSEPVLKNPSASMSRASDTPLVVSFNTSKRSTSSWTLSPANSSINSRLSSSMLYTASSDSTTGARRSAPAILAVSSKKLCMLLVMPAIDFDASALPAANTSSLSFSLSISSPLATHWSYCSRDICNVLAMTESGLLTSPCKILRISWLACSRGSPKVPRAAAQFLVLAVAASIGSVNSLDWPINFWLFCNNTWNTPLTWSVVTPTNSVVSFSICFKDSLSTS